MSDQSDEQVPKTQPASSGQPPRPPKRPARGGGGRRDASGKVVYLLDPMTVRELAGVLQLKPFRVIADLMELKVFKSPDETVDFETASSVARKHGYRPERPPPGVLVL